MSEYFSAHSVHCRGKTDISYSQVVNERGRCRMLVTVGQDQILFLKDDNSQEHQQLPSNTKYISVTINGHQCLLADHNTLYSRNLSTGQMTAIHQIVPQISSILLSPTGRYIAITTQEQKCHLIDTLKNRYMKCRPGHNTSVATAFFSPNEQYIGSIGDDQQLILYQITEEEQPQEISRNKLTKPQLNHTLMASFNHKSNKVACPGKQEVYLLELSNGKWEMRKTSMKHPSAVTICHFINHQLLATCCLENVYMWGYDREQKIIVVEGITFTKMVSLHDKLFAINDDGNVYEYNKPLPKTTPIEIDKISQQQPIKFDEQPVEQDDQQQSQYQHYHSKKSKADKIVTVFPQPPITRSTQQFQQSRFLLISEYGLILQRKQLEDTIIEAELTEKSHKIILFRNRQFQFFAISPLGIAFANEREFGVKINHMPIWEKKLFDIQGISIGNSWVAVITQQSIYVYDLTGNLLRCISFDRQFVAMDAYENILAVVYHQTIPLFGSQSLSMRLYFIDKCQQSKQNRNHLPITPKSTLKWFGFSKEGMLVSQDSIGSIRVYSLERKDWTKVDLCGVEFSDKIWMVGVVGYQVKFWRITDTEPQPTVFPRFNQKSAILSINDHSIEINQQSEKHMKLLWKRFCLEHQKHRWKLWNTYKKNRASQDILNYYSSNIITPDQLHRKHINLDAEYKDIIQELIKANQLQKAIIFTKTFIFTTNQLKNIVQLFDGYKHRTYAIQLEIYNETRQKEQEYQVIQEMELNHLRTMLEQNLKTYSQDPMKKNYKKIGEKIASIGLTQSQSQVSSEYVSHPKQNNIPKRNAVQEVTFENPFLKKTSTSIQDEKKMKEAQEYIAKFAKKKSEQKSMIAKQKRQLK